MNDSEKKLAVVRCLHLHGGLKDNHALRIGNCHELWIKSIKFFLNIIKIFPCFFFLFPFLFSQPKKQAGELKRYARNMVLTRLTRINYRKLIQFVFLKPPQKFLISLSALNSCCWVHFPSESLILLPVNKFGVIIDKVYRQGSCRRAHLMTDIILFLSKSKNSWPHDLLHALCASVSYQSSLSDLVKYSTSAVFLGLKQRKKFLTFVSKRRVWIFFLNALFQDRFHFQSFPSQFFLKCDFASKLALQQLKDRQSCCFAAWLHARERKLHLRSKRLW